VTTASDVGHAIAGVAEGFCPLCHVALITHDGRACCPCGGCSYRLGALDDVDDPGDGKEEEQPVEQ
jgi:hypothetical protein